MPLKHHTETAYLILLAAIVSVYGVLLSLLPHFPQGVLYWMILMVVSFLYPIVLAPTFRSNRADYEFRFLHWAPALMTLLWLVLEIFSGYKAVLILQLGFLYLWSLPLVVLALTLIILFCLHVIRRQSIRVPVIGGLLAAFFALSISAEAFGWNTPIQTALFPDNQYARMAADQYVRLASTVVPGSMSSSSSSTAVIAANISSSSVAARSSSSAATRASSSAWALPPVSSSRSSSSVAASSVRSSAAVAASLPSSAVAVVTQSSSSVRRSSSSSLSSSVASVVAVVPVSSSARSSSSLSSSAVSSSVARSSSSSSVAAVVSSSSSSSVARSSSSSSAPAVIAQNPPPTPAPTPPHLPQSGPEAFALILVTLFGLYCRTLHARAMRRLDVE